MMNDCIAVGCLYSVILIYDNIMNFELQYYYMRMGHRPNEKV